MATRIARERGWTVGREVGWHIRFDRQFTRETRLLVVTEGIMTAYLQQDPLLSDVSTIVLDEFHERSVHADLGLAMAKQAWLARGDLRILVMSATLDPSPVSRFLDDAPVIDVPGALHPLTVEYAPGTTMPDAINRVLSTSAGNVLCFLPGVRDIQQAISGCEGMKSLRDIEILPLHGSLDAFEQDAALTPATGTRRRVIVATNIAETSLTVPGVSAVIDSGVHKVSRYDADRAIDALVTERITLDSADQRAGRAARLGPGLALRLWDQRDRLRPHRDAEMHRVDLIGPLLAIYAWGSTPDNFEWFDPPSPDRIATAIQLLRRLGAVNADRITDLGRQMQMLPLSPRLARVLIAGSGSQEAAEACAALSDDRASQLEQSARRHIGDAYRAHITNTELQRALLAGYPDRVARRRQDDRYTLSTGHGAVLGRDAHTRGAEWLVALDVTAGRATATTEAVIRMAAPIDSAWLEPTASELRHEFDRESGTVKAVEIDWYDEVPLKEHPVAPAPVERARILAAEWLSRPHDDTSSRMLRRLAFAGIDAQVADLVSVAAATASRLADVKLSQEALPWETREALARLAPEQLTVPSGRQMTIEYGDDGTATVSVKLQELFGLAETPRLGRAHTPVTFELLAPNGRAVQTTRDLRSFWERTYPEVRKELRGRYPKHPWPDDPWSATPTHKTKRALGR